MIERIRRLLGGGRRAGALVGHDAHNQPVRLSDDFSGVQVIGSAGSGRVTRSAGPVLAQWVAGPGAPTAVVVDTRGSHALALAISSADRDRPVRVVDYRPGLAEGMQKITTAIDGTAHVVVEANHPSAEESLIPLLREILGRLASVPAPTVLAIDEAAPEVREAVGTADLPPRCRVILSHSADGARTAFERQERRAVRVVHAFHNAQLAHTLATECAISPRDLLALDGSRRLLILPGAAGAVRPLWLYSPR